MTDARDARSAKAAPAGDATQAALSAEATPALSLLPLTEAYLDELVAIEQLSFASPWSKEAYRRELTENDLAVYVGLFYGDRLIGYAGLWRILDEGHISNIAVHPAFRGHRFGELLLAYLQQQALLHKLERLTLEVRRSNVAAQTLYTRCGFVYAGIRPHYYNDNGEDAFIYWLEIGR